MLAVSCVSLSASLKYFPELPREKGFIVVHRSGGARLCDPDHDLSIRDFTDICRPLPGRIHDLPHRTEPLQQSAARGIRRRSFRTAVAYYFPSFASRSAARVEFVSRCFGKTWGFPSQFIESTKVLMATPQGRRLGYHMPEQVSNQEPPDS